MFTKQLLAAAAFAGVMCVPAYADDASTPPAEQFVPPRYNQLPQNYEEFATVYNKVLAALRDAGVQSIHKCFPAGTTPSEPHGWCQDKMKLPDRKGGYFSAVEIQRDDGKLINEVCLSDNSAEQRCFRNDGMVVDQALDNQTDIFTTYREVAGRWNERGKPLSDLNPNAQIPPSPPADATSPPADATSPPADATSPPADASILPPKYNQIPLDYKEFAAVYNKALTFLRTTGAQSIHECFPAGITPAEPIGWCQDHMMWSDPKGRHITVSDSTLDDGKHRILACFGDDVNTRRCYRDDGAVFDQTYDRKISLWVTFRQVAGAWNERGKAPSGLKAPVGEALLKVDDLPQYKFAREYEHSPTTLTGGNPENRYFATVYGMIKAHLHETPDLHVDRANKSGVVNFYLDKSGNVVGRKLISSSGSPNLDTAVMTAIAAAAPYPTPPSWRFRNLNYNFGRR
jgi:TonB family protein